MEVAITTNKGLQVQSQSRQGFETSWSLNAAQIISKLNMLLIETSKEADIVKSKLKFKGTEPCCFFKFTSSALNSIYQKFFLTGN